MPTDEELKARMDAWSPSDHDPPPYDKEHLLEAKQLYRKYRAIVDAEAARHGEPPYKYEYKYLMEQLEKMPGERGLVREPIRPVRLPDAPPLSAEEARRVTIVPKDIQLARRIRGERA